MRIVLFTSIILGIFACGEAPAGKPGFNPDASGVVLMYHHVDADTPPITSITPDAFAAQMAWLDQQDFDVWPLDRLIDYVERGQATPGKTVAITFDDAYISIYETAWPLLARYEFPFTIFVATEFVGTSDAYLTWDQLREMQQAGATIANHTHSHTHLLRARDGESHADWLARVGQEIVTASGLIEKHTGSTSRLFAYPYGEYNTAVLGVVRDLGMIGFGQHSGAVGMHDAREALPRFPMGGIYSDFDEFRTKIETLPLPIEPVRVDPLLTDDFQPRLTLNFLHEDLRLAELACYGPDGKTELTRVSGTRYVARTVSPVPVGRSRYNCSMPAKTANRFYWFSQPWIRKNPDGTWYPEP